MNYLKLDNWGTLIDRIKTQKNDRIIYTLVMAPIIAVWLFVLINYYTQDPLLILTVMP